jgi:hypothetical protein
MRRRPIPPSVRERVAQAAHYRCGYCLTSQRVIGPLLEIDHLLPEARGGTSHESNLWLACPLCNGHKADRIDARDPSSGEIVPLFNPRRDRWADHFEWNEGGAVIRGKTSRGRGTVDALHLNDEALVAARRLWVLVGWHPPTDV